MKTRVAAFLMMCHLLIGSTLLPLSDFSLLNELPHMYRAYEKLTRPGEQNFFDFVGDYLLGGKVLFGHNKHDLPDKNNAVQFQHITAFVFFMRKNGTEINNIPGIEMFKHCAMYLPGSTSDYHSSLLRPPLA